MIEKNATIKNVQGIHCRPSAVIIKSLQSYDGKAVVRADAGEASLQSIMGLLSLCLEQGAKVSVMVDGPNEDRICTELVELFETEFDFPPRDEKE